MSTRIYGCSDDLVEVEGDVVGEVPSSRGALLLCSDGTMLEIKYGKGNKGIWDIYLLQAGSLFDGLVICTDEESEIYSDVAVFKDGLKVVCSLDDLGDWEEVS